MAADDTDLNYEAEGGTSYVVHGQSGRRLRGIPTADPPAATVTINVIDIDEKPDVRCM